jgi:hypothetical protein
MTPIDYRDRENRFEDACKFAAALVAVGLIVFAGESAMRHVPDVPLTVPVHLAPAPSVEPFEYFPDGYAVDASAALEPHIDAF